MISMPKLLENCKKSDPDLRRGEVLANIFSPDSVTLDSIYWYINELLGQLLSQLMSLSDLAVKAAEAVGREGRKFGMKVLCVGLPSRFLLTDTLRLRTESIRSESSRSADYVTSRETPYNPILCYGLSRPSTSFLKGQLCLKH